MLCILTSKYFLRMLFAGQIHLFSVSICFSIFFCQKLKKRRKSKKIRKNTQIVDLPVFRWYSKKLVDTQALIDSCRKYCIFHLFFALFILFPRLWRTKMEKHVKTQKKMVWTSNQHVEHHLTGWNTQHPCLLSLSYITSCKFDAFDNFIYLGMVT